MKLKVLSVFTIALVLCGISFGQEVPSVSKPEAYLVGPGDVITGKVLGEEQFDFTATIDEDGKIEVPFFDQPIMAKCRSERELRADVTKLLSKYLRSPLVSVRITERKSRPPAVIYGEVRTPQKVELTRKSTLLELLSLSGGVTEDAGGMIQVFRTQPPICSDNALDKDWIAENGNLDVPSRMYSLSSLRQGLVEANPVINPGDVVVVQKAAPVYVTGEVRQPTGILLKEGGLSLYQAVAMVGGPNREAKTKDIKIYRLKPNSKDRQIISANYDLIQKGTQKDIMLEPYDIVEVDKSKKSIMQTILEIAIGAGRGGVTAVTQGLGTRVLY
ncbi:MAG: Polysaccharide export protein [Acidobacteria bacterium]|jgi:polysaccharide export outer membrane protein|nr:Polysaccharide export protein [Acidobacteriota bacterium]